MGGLVPDDAYVFVSYSRDDADYVHRLVDFLRAQGLRVWFDQQIPNGARWRETLAERVEHAAAMLLVESASAQASRWANEEFLYAEKKHVPLLVLVLHSELRFGLQGVHAEFVVDEAMPTRTFVDQVHALLAVTRNDTSESTEAEQAAPELWQSDLVVAVGRDRPSEPARVAPPGRSPVRTKPGHRLPPRNQRPPTARRGPRPSA
jgi:hypothetical protein